MSDHSGGLSVGRESYWIEGWVGIRPGLVAVEENTSLAPAENRTSIPLLCSLVRIVPD
jgi:hypothetical protein